MGYDIVKSIILKDNKVYLTSADGRSYPRTFEKWEPERLSEMYVKEGKEAVLAAIGENIWGGNYHLQKNGNKICRLFIEAQTKLPKHLNFSNMDCQTAGKYLGRAVMKLEEDIHADLSNEVNELLALMNDRDHIYEASRRTGHNFLNYASADVQKDREFALKVLKAAGDRAWFEYPKGYEDDKYFALEALKLNGCFYRSLSENLKADTDIIIHAFNAYRDRRFFEHLPDLIPKEVFTNNDKSFTYDLFKICPKMHIHRALWLLEDHDIALCWCKTAEYLNDIAAYLPERYASRKEFQDIIQERCKSETELEIIKSKLSVRGIAFPMESLEDKIAKAKVKQSQDNNKENKAIYKENIDKEM